MPLIDRVKNILLTPKTEWPVIGGETPTVQSLYVGYIVILAAIGPIAMAVRFGLFGMGLGTALISYVVALIMIYLLAWIVDALAPTFGGEKNFIRSLPRCPAEVGSSQVGGVAVDHGHGPAADRSRGPRARSAPGRGGGSGPGGHRYPPGSPGRPGSQDLVAVVPS